MLKLMKYEFKKQKFSKLVILFVAALLELYFVFGIVTDRSNDVNKSMVFLMLLTMGALFFVAFESIWTFSNDLKQKCSYMLFLTPKSAFTIVGAKVLTAGITVFLTGLSFFGLLLVNGTMILARDSQLSMIVDMFKSLLESVMNIDSLDIKMIVINFLLLLFSWMLTLTLAFFAITLSTTFLANSKARGVVSFIIFIILNVLFTKFVDSVTGGFHMITINYLLVSCLYMLCFIIITYVGTAWMLDKKISV